MIYVTTSEIQGKKIVKTIGVVKGSSVRAKWFGADIIANIRNVFGGEIVEYSNLLDQTRQKAIDRMLEDAKANGANAIVNVRFASSQIGQQAAEILVYGTAVVVKL
ncbi:hypothetical protein CMO88_01435 [Candidatus Woesearchaeota archaeon]|nr:hypothetical protein [Candidatus Woesearchaeota archaeon]|tara:strand:+ start:34132 stop:34449 length:318 start_codon:yes stop_codon:yes gene_type:complete